MRDILVALVIVQQNYKRGVRRDTVFSVKMLMADRQQHFTLVVVDPMRGSPRLSGTARVVQPEWYSQNVSLHVSVASPMETKTNDMAEAIVSSSMMCSVM